MSGPELPHRVDAGDKGVTWTIEASQVFALADSARQTFNLPAIVPFVAKVELGNGKTYRSRQHRLDR